MIDPAAVAEHFPHHRRGYLDNAAVAPVPAAVTQAVTDVGRALEAGTAGSAAWHERTDDAVVRLATDLGAEAARVVVLGNASESFSFAAHAIDLAPDDRIVTFADDFPTTRLPWTTRPGTRVELWPGPGDERTETLLAGIDERTKVVSVTEVHATTGTTLDLARVSAACRDVGALLVVDASQSAGLLSGGAAHADVYVAASYKWLLGGFGAAVVATSERFDTQATPRIVGYRNAQPSPRLHVGHSNLFGLAALQAGAEVRAHFGSAAVHDHTRRLVDRLTAGAASLGMRPSSEHSRAGIVSLAVPGADELVEHLRQRGLRAASRDGTLRLSPYLTTTEADVDDVLNALADVRRAH